MAYVSALHALFDSVVALAATEEVDASIVFGKREPHKGTNQGPGRANRIVFAPGDDKGTAGKYIEAKKRAGRNPRAVRTFVEFCRVYVWAWDSTDPRDELKQHEAVLALHEWIHRAIHLGAHGTFTLTAPEWIESTDVARLGEELRFQIELETPIFDTPYQSPIGELTSETTTTFVSLGGEEVDVCTP